MDWSKLNAISWGSSPEMVLKLVPFSFTSKPTPPSMSENTFFPFWIQIGNWAFTLDNTWVNGNDGPMFEMVISSPNSRI